LQEINSQVHGRGYTVSDAPLIEKLGIAGGYSAVLVLAFYLNSETVTALYAQPILIWFTLPLLFFWISWVWMKARRGKMHDDPVVFALKDKVSLLVAGLIAVFFVLAIKGVSI
jgi:4-hydroxybenzoate polyprenyltransferase